jgi:hypothetical protein
MYDKPAKRYPAKYEPSDFVFFLHIPKTAGTSVTRILESLFDERRIIAPKQFNNVRKHPREIFERAEFVAGHYPHREVYRRLPRKPDLTLTFLREPVAHFQSVFFHLQIDPTFAYTIRLLQCKDAAKRIHQELKGATLQDFLDSEHCALFENFQTRYLAGGLSNDYADYSDDQLLPIAESMLLGLPFFGITERFEDSVRLLEHVFDIDRPLPVVRQNAARNRPKNFQVSPTQRETIEQKTTADRKLYDIACLAFEHRLQAVGSLR